MSVTHRATASPSASSLLGTSALLFEAPGATDAADAAAHLGAGARGRDLARGARGGARHEQPDAEPSRRAAARPRRARVAAAGRLGGGRAADAARAAWSSCRCVYGGDGGPHLADVVAHTGPAIDEIVERHSAPLYPVYALGSHPGYCYLGGMDPRIATPRRKVPVLQHPRRRGVDRRRADRRLGVRRPERLEHHRLHRDALLRPGARPAGAAAAGRQHPLPRREGDPMIEILSSAALATVQDLGREGALRWGVGTAGAMDPLALAAGNLLLGNDRRRGGIEVPVFPFRVRFEPRTAPSRVTGADCRRQARRPAAAAVVGRARRAPARCCTLGLPRRGGAWPASRAYLCLAGGVDVPEVLGSRSTQLRGAFGGLEGRALRQGDGCAPPAAARPAARRASAWCRRRWRCRCRSTACRRCGCCRRPSTWHYTEASRAAFWAERLEDHRAERPLRLPARRRGRCEAGGADGDALARHRARRDPGAAGRPADRADARRAALGRLPEVRHRDRGRPVAARPGADRQPRALRRDATGTQRVAALDETRRWLAEVRRLVGLHRLRRRGS